MDSSQQNNALNFVNSYLNGILNINILLVTIGLVLLFWEFKDCGKIKNQWWLGILLFSITLGILSVILNLLVYRDLIDELTRTSSSLAGKSNYAPLSTLNVIFYIDIIILILLLITFFGIKYEKDHS